MSGAMQVPAFLQSNAFGGRSIAQQAATGINAAQPPHVSIKGNQFALVDSAGTRRPVTYMATINGQQQMIAASFLEVVIVMASPHVSKVYFEGSYNPNEEGEAPTCWSDNGEGPSIQ